MRFYQQLGILIPTIGKNEFKGDYNRGEVERSDTNIFVWFHLDKIIEGMKKDLRQTMVEECAEFKIYTKERKVIILNH